MPSSQLMRDFNFSEEDLIYNRRGEISPRQAAEEKTDAQGCRRASGMFVLVVAAVIVLGIVTGWEILQGLSVPLGIFGAVALGAFALTYSKDAPRVAAARGAAKLTMDRERNQGVAYHALIVNGTYFRIPAAAYEHLIEGASYAVYYFPAQSKRILSIEPVEQV